MTLVVRNVRGYSVDQLCLKINVDLYDNEQKITIITPTERLKKVQTYQLTVSWMKNLRLPRPLQVQHVICP